MTDSASSATPVDRLEIEEDEFTIEDMAAWDWVRRMHQQGYSIRKDAPKPLREALGM